LTTYSIYSPTEIVNAIRSGALARGCCEVRSSNIRRTSGRLSSSTASAKVCQIDGLEAAMKRLLKYQWISLSDSRVFGSIRNNLDFSL
jgi:hypothetical protein